MWGLHWFVSVSRSEHVWRPGGPAADVELLDGGESAAGGLARPGQNPISGLMNCASHVVEHRVRGNYVKTFRTAESRSRCIDNDNVDNDCFTVQMGSTAILFRFLIDVSPPHSLTKNDPNMATQYTWPIRANFMPFRPPSYCTIVLKKVGSYFTVLHSCVCGRD